MNIINDIKLYFLLRELRKDTKKGNVMKNWRTSIGGLVSIIGIILPQFGISHELASAVQVIGTAIIAYFAKDHVNTGTGA
ncbi:MAG: hypothetical protein HZA08_04885 [Nitrospirae bacterium]|nr:hypothetical protein [Nitrospirota bacterium]